MHQTLQAHREGVGGDALQQRGTLLHLAASGGGGDGSNHCGAAVGACQQCGRRHAPGRSHIVRRGWLGAGFGSGRNAGRRNAGRRVAVVVRGAPLQPHRLVLPRGVGGRQWPARGGAGQHKAGSWGRGRLTAQPAVQPVASQSSPSSAAGTTTAVQAPSSTPTHRGALPRDRRATTSSLVRGGWRADSEPAPASSAAVPADLPCRAARSCRVRARRSCRCADSGVAAGSTEAAAAPAGVEPSGAPGTGSGRLGISPLLLPAVLFVVAWRELRSILRPSRSR